jgi:hypothetical protein
MENFGLPHVEFKWELKEWGVAYFEVDISVFGLRGEYFRQGKLPPPRFEKGTSAIRI